MRRAVWSASVVVIAALLAVPAVSQDAAPSFDVGLSAGLLLVPDAGSLPTLGGGFGVSLSDKMEVRASYWRAGISFLGVSIMTIDVFDLALAYDMAPEKALGFYAFAGGAYLLAGALGEGIGGIAVTAGFGVRAQPLESIRLYVEYRPLIRSGILHVVQVGASYQF